jgi:predicted dehydrogenase/nucleoside-diphosphate-sugar epimerase
MGRQHLAAIGRLADTAHVTAVADPSPEARRKVAENESGIRTFESCEALLDAGEVDVIHVCTAPAMHEEVAWRALEAGCHVYVEKPFVESASAARRLLDLAREYGLVVCAGHQLLFEPPTLRALELLPALREIVHLESYFSFRPVRASQDGRAAMRPDEQLLDILPHPVYLLLRFLEEAAPGGTTEIRSIETGPAATVHVRVRRGGISSDLTVTLEGRPVESYLRAVGRNGSVHADYVRGTVQRLVGPGTSAIDKVLNPFRISRQLTTGTVRAVGERMLGRKRSYPGLTEIFEAFHGAVATGGASPTPEWSIVETVRFSERVAAALAESENRVPMKRPAPPGSNETAWMSSTVGDENGRPADGAGDTDGNGGPGPGILRAPPALPAARGTPRCVLITGGTGFLGREVVRTLVEGGANVVVLARREPANWERLPAAEYRVQDLGEPLTPGALRGVDTVVHCAAETAGGWEAHRRNSIDATRNLLAACRADDVGDVVHVSSIAVLAPPDGRVPVAEGSPLHPDGEAAGPYVWGKIESERLAREPGSETGPRVRVVRPPALVDFRRFEAPGKLGKVVGNTAVAVGGRREELAVMDVRTVAQTIAWIVWHPHEAPEILNLLPETMPSRGELVDALRRSNPDLRVVWLPRLALHPLSWLASGLQKALRPGAPAVSVARVFAVQRYDNALSSALLPGVRSFFDAAAASGRSDGAGIGARAAERATEEEAAERAESRREKPEPARPEEPARQE